jgi:hypothetical protein
MTEDANVQRDLQETQHAGPSVDTIQEMAVEAIAGNPDQAWKMLGLINDWIKHAETKAAGTIATSGVAASILYNLLKGASNRGTLIEVPATICGLCIAAASLSAAWALRPRLWARDEPTSNIYFDHIARRHGRASGAAEFGKTVRELTVEDANLISEIAAQIWANAHVARAKYRSAAVGLTAVLVALAALALTALAIAWTSW